MKEGHASACPCSFAFFEAFGVRSLLLFRLQIQRGRVHAIPQASWSGAILENMPKMRGALRAAHLRPPHAVGGVSVLDHLAPIRRLKETRPDRAGIQLRLRVQLRLAATEV